MEKINTNIFNLQKMLADDEAALSVSYKSFGKKLLSDTVNPVKNISAVEEKTSAEYQKLIDERNFCAESILEIKSSSARLEELDKFKKQVLKNQKEIENKISETRQRFVLALYADFKNGEQSCFESLAYLQAETETEIEELHEVIETLTAEKKEANILGKLGINRKIAGCKLKISSLQKKLEKQIIKNAEEIFSCPDVKFLYDTQKFSRGLTADYEKVLQLQTSKADASQHLANISEEYAFLTGKLSQLNASSSASKKTAALNSRMREIDFQTDAILEKCGKEYADSLADAEGNFKVGNIESQNLPDGYKSFAEEIAVLRKRISKTNYNIEYCKTLLQKEEAEAKIVSLNKAIESYKLSIKTFKERISAAENDIKASENDKTAIEEKLKELFAKFNEEEL